MAPLQPPEIHLVTEAEAEDMKLLEDLEPMTAPSLLRSRLFRTFPRTLVAKHRKQKTAFSGLSGSREKKLFSEHLWPWLWLQSHSPQVHRLQNPYISHVGNPLLPDGVGLMAHEQGAMQLGHVLSAR